MLTLLSCPLTALASSYSDLLLIIDQDGRGYTAQLTIFADDNMIVSRVPSDREILDTAFTGPGSAIYERAHEKSPNKITVVSGGVFTRFRHRFDNTDDNLNDADNSIIAPVLLASLADFSTTMADPRTLNYRVSWVLPPNIELLDHGHENAHRIVGSSSWSEQANNIVTFEQTGGAPSRLWLEYRVHSGTVPDPQTCLASVGPSEWCSPDTDNDGVPDYRDLCLPEQTKDANLPDKAEQDNIVLTENARFGLAIGAKSATVKKDSLGCENDKLVVLPQIQFESSQTYLNAMARATLDKVAVALLRMPDKLFRIASHTDNAGYFVNNQLLSENRAASVRHYLMLRGVGPNQIQAKGYGETQPAHDNSTATGRRNNRRVELHMLN